MCIDGYNKNSAGVCVINVVPQCQKNQVWDPINQICNCVSGYTLLNGCCKAITKCSNNSYWNGDKCCCNTGYQLDQNSQKCIPNTNTSVCPQNSAFNGVFCCCMDGFYPIQYGVCGTCPAGTAWNGFNCTSTIQNCSSGFYWSSNDNCCKLTISQCPINQVWNGIQCQCAAGFNLINGICQLCPNNTFFDGTSCSYGSSQCTMSNQIWNGNQCVCINGYFMINNCCGTCPSNMSWNGAQCVGISGINSISNCAINQININGVCVSLGY